MSGQHFRYSSLRERVVEHIFVGELLRSLWLTEKFDIEVAKSEVDNAGHDLVLESQGTLRHLQLKSSFTGAKTNKVSINTRLAKKPSGCVIWIFFEQESLRLGPFLWFGGDPGAPLPDLGNNITKHTKADSQGNKSERPSLRDIQKRRFEEVEDMKGLIQKLFG
ncbi:MAG: hypothetical protein MRY72_08700 [Aquisalinus sp.]|nr:hypothetical protein [Aquisalinus sp.]